MKKHHLFLLTTLAFIVACSGSKMIQPSQTDVDRGKDNFPGLTLEELQLGQQVFTASCNACHPYKKPSGHNAQEWAHIIPNMTGKANRKLGNTIDAAKEQALLRYVSVMASSK